MSTERVRAILQLSLTPEAPLRSTAGALPDLTLDDLDFKAWIQAEGGLELGVAKDDEGQQVSWLFEEPQQAIGCALRLSDSFKAADEMRVGLAAHSAPERFRVEASAEIVRNLGRLSTGGRVLVSKETADFLRSREDREGGLGKKVWWRHGLYLFDHLRETKDIYEVGLAGKSDWRLPKEPPGIRRLEDEDSIASGWRPARGDQLPDLLGWKLQRCLKREESGEVWVSIHENTHRRRLLHLIFHKEALQVLKVRSLWLSRWQRLLIKCRRVVKIFDYDLNGSIPFIMTARFPGKALVDDFEILEASLDVRLEVAAQLLDGLALVHRYGIVHGALSPKSIWIRVGSNGAPRIRLAGLMLPRPMLLPYERNYEIPGADPLKATTKSDIYACGVVVYQLICADLARPIGRGWRADVRNPVLEEAVASLVSCFQDGRYQSLRAVAEVLRGSSWQDLEPPHKGSPFLARLLRARMA